MDLRDFRVTVLQISSVEYFCFTFFWTSSTPLSSPYPWLLCCSSKTLLRLGGSKKIPWNKIPGTESSRTKINSRNGKFCDCKFQEYKFLVKIFWENSRTIFFQDRIFQDFLIPGKENSLKEFSRILEQFQEWKFRKRMPEIFYPLILVLISKQNIRVHGF